jgi:hypothetical protein
MRLRLENGDHDRTDKRGSRNEVLRGDRGFRSPRANRQEPIAKSQGRHSCFGRAWTPYLIVPRCPVEHVHDEPLRTEPGEDASEHRS